MNPLDLFCIFFQKVTSVCFIPLNKQSAIWLMVSGLFPQSITQFEINNQDSICVVLEMNQASALESLLQIRLAKWFTHWISRKTKDKLQLQTSMPVGAKRFPLMQGVAQFVPEKPVSLPATIKPAPPTAFSFITANSGNSLKASGDPVKGKLNFKPRNNNPPPKIKKTSP